MGNESKAIDYAVMLADLYAKRAGIDAAIAGLIAASGGVHVAPADAPIPIIGTVDRQPTELPRGAFLGKNLPAAIKLYLSAAMKTQTIKEIATALRDGGVKSTSDNFESVVTGCLNRMKASGEILRFKDGWGLPEFYPEHLRRSLSQGGAAKAKAASKKTKKGKKTISKPKPLATPVIHPRPVTGLLDRLEAYVRERKGEWVTFHQVVAAFSGSNSKVLALNLGKLAKKHKWEKSEDGKYRVGA